MRNKCIKWLESLALLFVVQIAWPFPLFQANNDTLDWRSFEWRGHRYQADTVREAFHPLAGQEKNLHISFKNVLDTIVDTPLSIILPSHGYREEWIIIAKDSLGGGSG